MHGGFKRGPRVKQPLFGPCRILDKDPRHAGELDRGERTTR